ncbi:MAG: CapA family protein [Pseudomonadota bacterium]|nr:CapA family protein [Pseudomonadota bacterium]
MLLITLIAACTEAEPPCFVFVGDVSLSRGVAAELAGRDPDGESGAPWDAFPAGEPWIGNLEGTLDRAGGVEAPCGKDPTLCLGITPGDLARLSRSPFVALSRANNHASDHGPGAAVATNTALVALGIAPITEAPTYLTAGGLDLAFLGVDLSAGDTQAALERIRLPIGKASARTPWVVVVPHWGIEGVAALGPGQETIATLFRTWGARIIVGAHAHVPQGNACSAEAATWYGLGNHLFDQRPPPTHEGALVRCCSRSGALTCTETRTRRTARSVLPAPGADIVSTCTLATPADADRSWEIHPWRDRFEFVQAFPSAGAGTWFALHRAWSDLDDEEGLRPYVFRVEGARYVEVWRGSSLARPIVAARLFAWKDEQLLCALHRADSFLAPNPTTRDRVSIVYRWNGFGFRAVEDAGAIAACAGM